MGFAIDNLFGEPSPGAPPRPNIQELLLSAVGSASQNARSPIARGLGAFSGVLGQQLGAERRDPQAAFLRQLQDIPFEPPPPPTRIGQASLSAGITEREIPTPKGLIDGRLIQTIKTSAPPKISPDILVPPPPPRNLGQLIRQTRPDQRADEFGLIPKLGAGAFFQAPQRFNVAPGGSVQEIGTTGQVREIFKAKEKKTQTPTHRVIEKQVGGETHKILVSTDRHGASAQEDLGLAPPPGTETKSLRDARRVRVLTARARIAQARLKEASGRQRPFRPTDEQLKAYKKNRQDDIKSQLDELKAVADELKTFTPGFVAPRFEPPPQQTLTLTGESTGQTLIDRGDFISKRKRG